MKLKIQQIFKICIFIAFISIVSCEEDESHPAHPNQKTLVKEIPLDQLLKQPIFSDAYKKMSKAKLDLLAKTSMENEYGFTIPLVPAKVIETDSLTSYTLFIERDSVDSAFFENLVIQINPNGETKAVIFKYNLLTPSILTADDSFSLNATVEVTPIIYNPSETNKTGNVCITYSILMCDYGGHEHTAGANCGSTYLVSQTDCIDAGGTGGGYPGGINYGGVPSTGTVSGTHTGGGGSNGSGTQIITSPVNVNFSLLSKQFYQSLNTNQMNWIRNIATQEISDGIYDYLASNFYSEESKSYIKNTLIGELMNQTNNDTNWSSNITILDISGPQITNINEYLECFNANQSAVLTIYADQPTPNSKDSWSGDVTDPDVGHTFISIKQGNIRRVIGFYPNTGVNPFTSPSDSSALINDSGHYFDTSISSEISATNLKSVLTYIKNYPSTYNLNSYNCTDFGINVSKLGGISIPPALGKWPGGSGDNPGQLGQNIRTMPLPPSISTVRNTTGGTSPSNSGSC